MHNIVNEKPLYLIQLIEETVYISAIYAISNTLLFLLLLLSYI